MVEITQEVKQAQRIDHPRVVAIIPAYNEERFIGSVVLKVCRSVNDVVVVDDGSNDETAEIAQADLPRHFAGRLEVRAQDRVLLRFFPDIAPGVYINGKHRLGLVDDQERSLSQPYFPFKQFLNFLLDTIQIENRHIATVSLDLIPDGIIELGLPPCSRAPASSPRCLLPSCHDSHIYRDLNDSARHIHSPRSARIWLDRLAALAHRAALARVGRSGTRSARAASQARSSSTGTTTTPPSRT